MAQLPDENIVALPQLGSRRPVSSIDVSGYARGAAAIGTGVETLGKGVASAAADVAAVLQKEREAEQKLGNASASASLQSGLLEDASAIDAETDPTDLEERYTARANERVQAAKQLIKNERQQQLFELSQQDNITRVIQAAKKKQFTLLRDGEMAADIASMNLARENGIKQSADNRKTLDLATGTIHGYVDKWVEKKYMDPVKAGEYKRKAAQDLVEGKLLALPVAEKYEALSGGPAQRFDRTPHAALLDRIAQEEGVPANLLKGVAWVESGGNAAATKGSYKGLFQLSDEKFKAFGGAGDIFDPEQNARVGARSLKAEIEQLRTELGREPTLTEIYLAHQQGQGGLAAHMADPDQPAWQNMLSTGEGKKKGADWAKKAVWGNVPDDIKKRFPNGVESLSSRQFMALWEEKLTGGVAGRYADVVSLLPPDRREQLRLQAERENDQATAKASYDAFNGWQRQIADAANGQGVLPERRKIETDINLLPQDMSRALGLLDKAAADVAPLKNFASLVRSGQKPNPEDPEAHRLTDKYFLSLGGNQTALQKTLDDTGILPKSAAGSLQDNLQSADAKTVAAAMEFVSSLPPSALVKVDGHEKLREAANVFEAGLAARRTPIEIAEDYKADRDERRRDPVKYAQTKDTIAKHIDRIVTIDFVESELSSSGSTFAIGGSNGARSEIVGQVQVRARQLFQKYDSRDPEVAVRQAIKDVASSYGPSTAIGPSAEDPKTPRKGARLVQYAPSAVPMYRNDKDIQDPDQASKLAVVKMIEDTNKAAGVYALHSNIKPDDIIIEPSPLFNETGKKFYANNPADPPMYLVSYTDRNGIRHPFGKVQFTPQELRDAEHAARRAKIDEEHARLEAERRARLLDTPSHRAYRLSPEDQALRTELVTKRDEERSAQQAARIEASTKAREDYVDPRFAQVAAIRRDQANPAEAEAKAKANVSAIGNVLSDVGSQVSNLINPPRRRTSRRTGE